ncbi:MAG: hypothetical protein ACOYK8_09270 [Alphaproteobacteria bacterium]
MLGVAEQQQQQEQQAIEAARIELERQWQQAEDLRKQLEAAASYQNNIEVPAALLNDVNNGNLDAVREELGLQPNEPTYYQKIETDIALDLAGDAEAADYAQAANAFGDNDPRNDAEGVLANNAGQNNGILRNLLTSGLAAGAVIPSSLSSRGVINSPQVTVKPPKNEGLTVKKPEDFLPQEQEMKIEPLQPLGAEGNASVEASPTEATADSAESTTSQPKRATMPSLLRALAPKPPNFG